MDQSPSAFLVFFMPASLKTATKKLKELQERLAALAPTQVVDERERDRVRKAKQRRAGRDIGSWQFEKSARRLACEGDLERFCTTYFPRTFHLPFSDGHRKMIHTLQESTHGGGLFAMAMPRGGGKTSLCVAAALYATLNGYHKFVFVVASTQPKAKRILESIQTILTTNDLLLEDFREACFPLRELDGIANRCAGQLSNNRPTHVAWTKTHIALAVLENAPCSGAVIMCDGITASDLRGPSVTKPDGTTLRPSFVILDDPQTDESARSSLQTIQLRRIIDGAVLGMVEPTKPMAVVMPCTVIYKGDLADTYLNREIKPEWRGARIRMVESWPGGITDTSIDETTDAGRLWLTYNRLRIRSLQRYEDIRLATKWYVRHREEMDTGFVCSWPERFIPGQEVSAQQHAMNLRLRNGDTFCAEYQQEGTESSADLYKPGITSKQLAERVIQALPRRSVLLDTHHLVAFVDVQDEILFYVVLGVASDFTGAIVDYGTFPPVESQIFSKQHTERWGLLSRMYFEANPTQRSKATVCDHGYAKPPLEDKLYHALSVFVPQLLNHEFPRVGSPAVARITQLGIDVRWGKANEVLKRYVRQCGFPQVIPYMGQSFPPTRRQLEDYTLSKGWLFEHQRHAGCQSPKWVYRPGPDGQLYLSGDVDRLKDFLFERLMTPIGSRGSIALFANPVERHGLFASHVCDSEYPEPVTARGYEKNQYQTRSTMPDNDWLDCCAGAVALASFAGACLQFGPESAAAPGKRQRSRKITDKWRKRA